MQFIKNKSKWSKDIKYEIFLIPVLIAYTIFFVVPVLSSFGYSFTDWSKYSQTFHFVGLDNYKKLFEDKDIITGIKNSVIFALVVTFFHNILSVPLSVALDRPLRGKNILRSAFFLPVVLSMLIVGYLWSNLMSSADYGLFNKSLSFIGISPVNWLGDAKIALYSIIFTQIWQWVGWDMIIYIANLQGIPQELYEAAEIDGASGIQKFFYITVPLLYPAASICLVTGLVNNLKVFDIIFSMTQGGPGGSTESILTVMIKRGTTEGLFGYSSAFGVVFLIIVLLITLVIMKVLKKWEESIS